MKWRQKTLILQLLFAFDESDLAFCKKYTPRTFATKQHVFKLGFLTLTRINYMWLSQTPWKLVALDIDSLSNPQGGSNQIRSETFCSYPLGSSKKHESINLCVYLLCVWPENSTYLKRILKKKRWILSNLVGTSGYSPRKESKNTVHCLVSHVPGTG